MANNYYKAKTWNAICDSCGFKFKSDQLKKRWDGLMVDEACWEPRQPQDFLRAVRETSNTLPWTRPDVTPLVAVPIANFTATPTMGAPPLNVQFTDTSMFTPTSWSWNFGDGSTSTSQNPLHTFATEGAFNVTLTATNSAGSNTIIQYYFVVAETAAPVSLVGWDPARCNAGLALSGNNLICSNNLGGEGKVIATKIRSLGEDSRTYQFEIKDNSAHGAFNYFGIAQYPTNLNKAPGNELTSWGWSGAGAHIRNNNGIVSFCSALDLDDVMGLTFNAATGAVRWYKNGVLQSVPATAALTGSWYPAYGNNASPLNCVVTLNLGATAFAYPIAGAVAWIAT